MKILVEGGDEILQVEVVLIQNCNFIAKLIELQKNKCTLSCINPRMVPSLFFLESRLHHVLLSKMESRENLSGDDQAQLSSGWKTQNIHTELIYKLNPKRNIGQAYKNFGANISDDGSSVLCICCNGAVDIEEYVKSNFDAMNVTFILNEKEIEEYLKTNVDTQTINKLFNFSKEEIAKFPVELNMIANLAVRDFN